LTLTGGFCAMTRQIQIVLGLLGCKPFRSMTQLRAADRRAMQYADFIIVGGGIAGACVAYHLAPKAKVILLEAEAQPGFHASGRSAATLFEGYGSPLVRAMTKVSRNFFARPPGGFASYPVHSPRGALVLAATNEELRSRQASLDAAGIQNEVLHWEECESRVPILREGRFVGAVFEPNAADLDVMAMLQGYFAAARRAGATICCDEKVLLGERDGSGWIVHTRARSIRCEAIINCAGAWADELAASMGVSGLGLTPKRRAAFTFHPPEGVDSRNWPFVTDCSDTWYFKPDAGALMASPGNADPVLPHDVRPEEIDIAIGIDAIQTSTTMSIPRPYRTWAGLRTFAPDEDPVVGYDANVQNFFWCAGQGGYGVQTSPAMGRACSALVLGAALPGELQDAGLTAAEMSPSRFN
jgi:D-arginine dehydrogenase